MGKLLDDIRMNSNLAVEVFAADDVLLNYTINSFIEVDKYFNRHVENGKPKVNGPFEGRVGILLFCIGSYVGETIIKNVPDSVWEIDENDPRSEITAAIKLPDGNTIYPLMKTANRFRNGEIDSLYVYGYHVTKDYINEAFDTSYFTNATSTKKSSGKPWWKMW